MVFQMSSFSSFCVLQFDLKDLMLTYLLIYYSTQSIVNCFSGHR